MPTLYTNNGVVWASDYQQRQKAEYGVESVGAVSFQTREFPEQRNIELQRL